MPSPSSRPSTASRSASAPPCCFTATMCWPARRDLLDAVRPSRPGAGRRPAC
jgi:hypothetical protein